MSTEHFYWFIERTVVDPLLATSWTAFLRKYPRRRSGVNELLAFAVEPEPDAALIADILSRRTLRWTLQRCSPAYFALNEILSDIPGARRACPEVHGSWQEDAVLAAVAYDAFLDGRLDEKTTRAVFRIGGAQDPRDTLDLSRSELKMVKDVILPWNEESIFPWLRVAATGDGYSGLRTADAKRFITFLTRAWDENWPVRRLNGETLRDLNWRGPKVPRFHDFELAKGLARHAKSEWQKPCVVRYFG